MRIIVCPLQNNTEVPFWSGHSLLTKGIIGPEGSSRPPDKWSADAAYLQSWRVARLRLTLPKLARAKGCSWDLVAPGRLLPDCQCWGSASRTSCNWIQKSALEA